MPAWPTGGAAPDPNLLLEGAGIFYFDRFDVDGNPQGFLDLGNVETLEATTTDTRIQKNSSRTKSRPLYKDVLQKRDIVLKAAMDEFSPDNVALVMMGNVTASAAQAATAVVAESLAPALHGVKFGASYKTAKLGPISAVVVKQGATTLVLGTDYTIQNAAIGVIRINNVPATGGFTEGGVLTIDYTPTAYADGLTQVAGGTESKIEGAGLFVSDNSQGPNWIVEFWKLSAQPSSAIAYISDTFGSLGLQFTVEDDSVNHPTFPLWRKTFV